MSIEQAMMKVLEGKPNDLMHFLSSFPAQLLLRVQQVKHSTNGQAEYVGFAPPDALLTDAKWLIFKNIYDAENFNTQKLLANGELKFNKVFNDGSSNYANYTYTTT